ncbi:hypothetical protein [Proteus mirabilis]|uniref:hypothetical protein n=1 Tax=Proteus mirabilis TaxID=584 RepID=UPI00157D6C5C|nr:hypothetical protein [Proteus mirabilis]EKU5731528.1 hypothetical protein [Proteus mirabilis]MCZ5107975.1 hypothetical protein [Proteus mirabilis]UHD48531.1 hypothetical protein LUA10_13130 [Proteus mirabilis]UHD50945.1 hypothetical protein LUA10_06385 [Proteus mirabilis]USA33589.1 hypothetical protein NBG97_06800 [Proteus mirabilis]
MKTKRRGDERAIRGYVFGGKQIFVSEWIRDVHRQHHVEQRIPFYILNGSHYF